MLKSTDKEIKEKQTPAHHHHKLQTLDHKKAELKVEELRCINIKTLKNMYTKLHMDETFPLAACSLIAY